MVTKFRNAHAVAKHSKSLCDYQLCKLEKVKGLDIRDTYMYMNDKAAATFVRAIANVAREEVCKTLNRANNVLFSYNVHVYERILQLKKSERPVGQKVFREDSL